MTKNDVPKLADHLLRHSSRGRPTVFFITGTDTGVGKTWVTTALLREFRRRGVRSAGFKPICCGDRTDAEKLWKCSNREISLDVVNPVHLRRPLAPVSQRCPSWAVLLRRIRAAFSRFDRFKMSMVLVEGAGGLLCPVDQRNTMRDLARALGLPVVIVARNRLGVLNHTLMTVEAARTSGLKCAAIVLTRQAGAGGPSRATNASALARLTSIPLFKL